MTFEWPHRAARPRGRAARLVGLLWLARRRDSRYAIRFSNVDVLAEVAQATRSPWRFVPPVAAARGARRAGRRAGAPQRLGLGRAQAGHDRARARPLRLDAGPGRPAGSHHGLARGCAALRQEPARRLPRGRRHVLRLGRRRCSAPSFDRSGAAEGDPGIQAGGGTAIGDAIDELARPARRQLQRDADHGDPQGARHPAALRRLEHARASTSPTAADAAKRAGVPVYTIALGTPRRRARPAGARRRAPGTIPVPARSRRAEGDRAARPAASRSPRSTSRRSRRSTTTSARASARPRNRRS